MPHLDKVHAIIESFEPTDVYQDGDDDTCFDWEDDDETHGLYTSIKGTTLICIACSNSHYSRSRVDISDLPKLRKLVQKNLQKIGWVDSETAQLQKESE